MSRRLREALGRAPRGLLGMLALMLPCEYFFAHNDLKFSRLEAEDWKHTARVAAGELPSGGVFFFGDSQVKFGVSPLLLESKLGQPSHCLAIQAGQAPSTYFLLKRALASGIIPSAIVVDFEPHLLRDGLEHNRRTWGEMLTLPECLELAWNARSGDAFASMALGRYLSSYRERYEIRDNLMAALRGETPVMASWIEMAVRNKGMNRGALAMSTDLGKVFDIQRWGNPTPGPWAPDRVNDLYARKFLRLCRDLKIPVYCLLMPVIPAVQEKYAKNGMDDHYFAWLRGLQDKYANLYVLDWRHSNYSERSFTDCLHLNVEGALSITAALAEHIKKSFRGEGVDRRWVAMPEFRTEGIEIAVEDSGRSNALMMSTASRRR